MGTVLRFPGERCRRGGEAAVPAGRLTANVVILPAIRIERHDTDSDAPAMRQTASRRGTKRRRQTRTSRT
jgi:hypothetical protein